MPPNAFFYRLRKFLFSKKAHRGTDVATPFRSSDHDPVLIGVNFAGIRNVAYRPQNRLFVYPGPAAGPQAFSLAKVPASAGALTLDFALPQGLRLLSMHGAPALLEQQLNTYTAHLAPGIQQLQGILPLWHVGQLQVKLLSNNRVRVNFYRWFYRC